VSSVDGREESEVPRSREKAVEVQLKHCHREKTHLARTEVLARTRDTASMCMTIVINLYD
jgi:hypothetical protein